MNKLTSFDHMKARVPMQGILLFLVVTSMTFLPIAEARTIGPFHFRLNETIIHDFPSFYIEDGKPNLKVGNGEETSFPFTILSATQKPVELKFYATISNEGGGRIVFPPGVNIQIIPDQITLHPNENQTIIIRVIAAEKAPADEYNVRVYGSWPEIDGFSSTSFSLHVGENELECDLEKDLENYEELLQNDIVVRTFLEKYPKAVSTLRGIDESIPPKADIVYTYENEKKIELFVYVREYEGDKNYCFWPFSYRYEDSQGTRIGNNIWDDPITIVNYLQGIVTASPYKQLKLGISLDDIVCRENLVLHLRHDARPICITEETRQVFYDRNWGGSLGSTT